MWAKKQQLEWDMEQLIDSKLGKEYDKAIYRHPAYITYTQNTSCEMLGWRNHKLEQRFLSEVSTTSDIQVYHSNGRKWRGTKETLDEGERRELKAGLKFNIQKTKIMTFSPITSLQTEEEKVEVVIDFIFFGSKNHCRYWPQPGS